MDDDTGNLSEDDRKLKRTAGDRTEDPADESVTDGNRFLRISIVSGCPFSGKR